jgi:hypothetical protein
MSRPGQISRGRVSSRGLGSLMPDADRCYMISCLHCQSHRWTIVAGENVCSGCGRQYDPATTSRSTPRLAPAPLGGRGNAMLRLYVYYQAHRSAVVLAVVLTLVCIVGVAISRQPGLSSTPTAPADCIVLAMGGNTLCGQTASAWCQSTDSGRAALSSAASDAWIQNAISNPDSPRGTPPPLISAAQSTCDQIESDYPN